MALVSPLHKTQLAPNTLKDFKPLETFLSSWYHLPLQQNLHQAMSSSSSSSSSSSCSPPWEVVLLLSHHLDPKSLAMSSCVCKSWSSSMSSDHLWKPHCLSHYPSLSSLRLIDPTVSYRRLFSLGHTASNRHHRPPFKPHISLSHLLFTIDVFHNDSLLLSLAKSGDELDRLDTDRQSGVFHFGVSVEDVAAEVPKSGEGLKVAWTAVLKGWRGVFSLIDCKGNGKLVGGSERWFSEELPAPGCCGAVATGGMGVVAQVGLGFCGGVGEGKMKVEKVSMGLLSVVSWRYLSVEDGLRYLQYFLLPSNA